MEKDWLEARLAEERSIESIAKEVGKHASTVGYRCPKCSMERVAAYRRRTKEILVEEAGGRCRVCGYDSYVGALHFHHLDPTRKRFQVSRAGTTGALQAMRSEARKCVLLCANCHAEVEAGLVLLTSPADNPG